VRPGARLVAWQFVGWTVVLLAMLVLPACDEGYGPGSGEYRSVEWDQVTPMGVSPLDVLESFRSALDGLQVAWAPSLECVPSTGSLVRLRVSLAQGPGQAIYSKAEPSDYESFSVPVAIDFLTEDGAMVARGAVGRAGWSSSSRGFGGCTTEAAFRGDEATQLRDARWTEWQLCLSVRFAVDGSYEATASVEFRALEGQYHTRIPARVRGCEPCTTVVASATAPRSPEGGAGCCGFYGAEASP
jgi:hypothetical protein